MSNMIVHEQQLQKPGNPAHKRAPANQAEAPHPEGLPELNPPLSSFLHFFLDRAYSSLRPASQNSCSSWKNSVKLMMVPYINRPPTMDMTAAPPAICAEWYRRVGRATSGLALWSHSLRFRRPSTIPLFIRREIASM